MMGRFPATSPQWSLRGRNNHIAVLGRRTTWGPGEHPGPQGGGHFRCPGSGLAGVPSGYSHSMLDDQPPTAPIGVSTWVWTSPMRDASLADLGERVAAMGFDTRELPCG